VAEKISPPTWLGRVNRVLLAVHRVLPRLVPSPVLTLPGRRTGKLRQTPVSVLDLDGRRYLLAGFPGADWAANARAAGAGTLSSRGRVEHVRLIEADAAEALPVLRAWPVRIAPGAKIMRDNGVVPDLEPDSFAALVGRCPVFRIENA